MSKKGALKEDITPTAIVKEFNQECIPYEKYRNGFKVAYNQMLTNIGMEESDWEPKGPRDLKWAVFYKNLRDVTQMSGNEAFLNEAQPIFEAAIAVENDFHQKMKKQMQVIYDFYHNSFEQGKAEIAVLAPELEAFQKNRPTDPEKIQAMDKVTSRFTELQRSLKQMVQPGVESIEYSHLKAFREVTELFQTMNEQLAVALAPVEKMRSQKKVPRKEVVDERAKKLAEDDRDD